MTGRRGLTGTVESFAATVRNIVQLGMGGPPFEATAEEKPAQAVTSQASTNPKSTYDNYRLLLKKTCRWRLSGPAQYDHCVRRRQGLQCVFHQPAASAAKGRLFCFSLSLSLPLSSEHRGRSRPPASKPTRTLFVRRRGVTNEYNPPCVANA